MSKKINLAGVIFVLLTLTAGVFAAIDSRTLEVKLDLIRGWEFGQSRVILTEIEELALRKTRDAADLKVIEKSFCTFLKSDASNASRQFICRQLSVIGTGDCADVLGGMLVKADMSDMARYALERIGGLEAEGAMVNALGVADNKIKVGIINSLGVMGSEAAVSKIAANLSSSDGEVASAAANALGQIGGEQATASLKKAMYKTQGEVGQVVAYAYLRCADKLAEACEKDKAKAVAIYDELLAGEQSKAIRSAALRGKIVYGSNAAATIGKVLAGDDIAMQTVAIQLVRDVEGVDVLQVVTANISKLGKVGQIQLLSALSDKGDKNGMGAVMSLIASEDEEIRIAAIQAVGYLGGAESVAILSQIGAASKGATREASREAMARIKGRGVNLAIADKIKSADTAVKVELVRALGARYAQGKTGVLLTAAADSDRRVRVEAIKALRDIAGDADMAGLVKLMSENQIRGERGELAKTITAAAGRMSDEQARANEVLKVLGGVDNGEIKVSMLELLGKLGGEKGYSVLIESMKDKDEAMRVAAIKGLSAWENAKPAAVLLGAAEGGASAREKVLAFRGYVTLAGLGNVDNKTKMKMYRQAMEIAPGVSEKRLVLSGLARTKYVPAMEMAAEYLDSNELKAESQSAVVKIAFLVRGMEGAKVQAILEKVSKEAKSKSVKAGADKEIGKIKSRQ